jgi:acetyl esterase/lipase
MRLWFVVAVAGAIVVTTASAEPVVFKDLEYANHSDRNTLDLYVPEIKGAPIVVFIHGGAFRAGDKRRIVGLERFLNAGFAVASINYRYSTEDTWPAQLEDLNDAFRFVRRHGEEYGYDSKRVASFGPSAGGHLSAMAGIALSNAPESRLSAVVVWFPPIDFTKMDDDIERTGIRRRSGRNDAPGSPESTLIGATVATDPELAMAASPLTYLDALPDETELPPFLIMHGAVDPLIARGQSGRLFQALLAHNGLRTLEYVLLPNGGHGTGDFRTQEAIDRVISFLANHMMN